MRKQMTLLLLFLACPEPVEEPPCVPQQVVRGPWAVGYHESQAEIRWETEQPGCGGLRLRAQSGGDWMGQVASVQQTIERTLEVGKGVFPLPDLAGPSVQHRVALTGLSPNSCYQYQLSQVETVILGRFCTAARPDSRETVRFALIGDTNPTMGMTAELYDHLAAWAPNLILHAGDIQYYESIIETWAEWFDRSRSLLQAAAVLPVVGNHEFEALDDEVEPDGVLPRDFTEYYQPIWGDHGHPGPGNNYAYRVGGILMLALDSESETGDMWSEAVQAWIVDSLRAAEADPSYRFTAIYFHRPLLSRSKYGGLDARRAELLRLISPYRVRLIMAGHAHCYERFIEGSRTWIVSGGGGALPHFCDRQHDNVAHLQQVAVTTYHWVGFTLTASGLTGEVFDGENRIIDRFEIGG